MSYNTYSSRPKRRVSYGSKSRYHGNRSKRTAGGRGQYIDPAKFVAKANPVELEAYVPTHQFSDFAVHELVKQNLAAKNYKIPSPIQDQTIPLGIEGKDIIGIANTGTGKTAAFAVPIVNRLLEDQHSRALIVAPTRELAQQIKEELDSISKNSKLLSTLLIGGASIGLQLRYLRSRPRIIIGTPGRIKDHLERGSLRLDRFNVVVLDEVDRMLDMGFLPDMRFILDNVSKTRQSFFFSATMDKNVRTLIDDFSNNPVTVSVKTGDTSDNVHQDVVHYTSKEDKMEKLHDALIQDQVKKVIIFDETQRSVERLNRELAERGFATDAIHGGKSQGQRQRALRKFKQTDIDILVATDVAARGIDVADITHVINYGLPQTYEDYTHRIGRAGRAGKVGHALTFVNR